MGKRSEKTHCKRRYDMNIWKDVAHSLSSEKCELKQWNTIIHLLQWQKSKNRQRALMTRM